MKKYAFPLTVYNIMTRQNASFYIILSIVFFILLLPQAVFAQKVFSEQERIATRLQKRYDSMQSLDFIFYQQTQGSISGRPQVGEGQAVFLKTEDSAYMRWDYMSPNPQVLLSDGVLFKMYFEELAQMIVTPAETLESDITYSFFTGKGKLSQDFTILPADTDTTDKLTESHPSAVIKLIPKKEQSQVQDIHLWVTEDSLISRIQIRDHFGTTTILSFSDIEVDGIDSSPASLKRFDFEPPIGTEIIEQ